MPFRSELIVADSDRLLLPRDPVERVRVPRDLFQAELLEIADRRQAVGVLLRSAPDPFLDAVTAIGRRAEARARFEAAEQAVGGPLTWLNKASRRVASRLPLSSVVDLARSAARLLSLGRVAALARGAVSRVPFDRASALARRAARWLSFDSVLAGARRAGGLLSRVPIGPRFVELARRRIDLVIETRQRARRELQAAREDLTRRQAEVRDIAPSTRFGLTGLALSGGGIRSATLSVGLLQSFAEHGLLKHADYLSTVSGGSFIGGCLSSMLTDAKASVEGTAFPLAHAPGGEETPAVKRVRGAARYLAPGGFFDAIRIPALLVRGVVINLIIVLPWLILGVVVTEVLWGPWLRTLKEAPAALSLMDAYWLSLGLAVLWVVGVVYLLWVQRVGAESSTWDQRNAFERLVSVGLFGVVTVAIVQTVPLAVFYYYRYGAAGSGASGTRFGAIATFVVSIAPVLFAARASGTLSTWSARVRLYAFALLAPLTLFAIYLKFASDRVFNRGALEEADWTGTILFFRRLYDRWARSTVDAFLPAPPTPEAPGTAAGGLMSALLQLVAELDDFDWILLGFGFAIFVCAWLFFEVNLTSLHGFYRDRLSDAYVFRFAGAERVHLDGLRLSELRPAESRAPYHLVNAALNLQGSARPGGRKADFFTFSKLYCGSDRTGYCRTTALETADERLNLATAMAISGAALAPNMGSSTVPSMVFVMTLLNIRTGYWLPNPRVAQSRVHQRGVLTGVGQGFLLMELFGRLHEHSRYVNVTDGGHMENLGLYELLRRRCRFIIVCDGEEDENLTFGSLATVMRYAKIDRGIDIDCDLTPLRRGPDGFSPAHAVVGAIRYDTGETGTLLYIKSSLTGDESEDIREYRHRHPAFPHEPTEIQFFDEEQFEAYRALGYHIGRQLFEHAGSLTAAAGGTSLEEWFRRLATDRDRWTQRDEELEALECALEDPAAADYRAQVGGRPAPRAVDLVEAIQCRPIVALCRRQIEFLARTFGDERLHDRVRYRAVSDRWWFVVFRRWAAAPYFRQVWALLRPEYPVAFQDFCARELGLTSVMRWRPGARLSAEQVADLRAAPAGDTVPEARAPERLIAELSLADQHQARTLPVGELLVQYVEAPAGVFAHVRPERWRYGGIDSVLDLHAALIRDVLRRSVPDLADIRIEPGRPSE